MERGTVAIVGVAIWCVMVCPYAAAATASTIYRCIDEDIVTYSDRPCASNASEYEPDEARISILEVAPPSTTTTAVRPKPKRAAADSVSIAAGQAKHAEHCGKLERSLRDIRSKMRAGYDAKEGERLRERRRKLSAQHRELRC